ncbi:MAG: hypothetical protein ACI837_003296 [Crocinitomicaceae bacterium]|jgi:hypothetical protein
MTNYFKHKMRGKNPAMIAGLIVLAVIGIAGLAILFGFIIMWLWNGLMPELFGLTTISYWQGIGLFILAKILLGGFGGKNSSSSKNSNSSCDKNSKKKSDFSKWEHYDKFWKEKGDQAYQEYVDDLSSNELGTNDEKSTEV